jgi:hypothetical protein
VLPILPNAIVRHILTGETLSEGKTTPIKIGILMVWQQQDGRWKLLAGQAYKNLKPFPAGVASGSVSCSVWR